MKRKTKSPSNGIIQRGDGYVMQCGPNEYPVRLVDEQGREVKPEPERVLESGDGNA